MAGNGAYGGTTYAGKSYSGSNPTPPLPPGPGSGWPGGFASGPFGKIAYAGGSPTPTPPVPPPPTELIEFFNGLAVFETPVVRDRPPYLPDSSPRQVGLWRHFENRLRGVLVWKRNNNTYCQDTPSNYESAQTHPAAYIQDDPIGPDLSAEEQVDSDVSYPWNPHIWSNINPQEGAYVWTTNWDQTTELFTLEPNLFEWWQGGAKNVITQFQARELTLAGYGDCIRDYSPDLDPTVAPEHYIPYSGGTKGSNTGTAVGPTPPPPPPPPPPTEGFGQGPFGEEPFGG